jgi:hypothetical protein
MAVGIAVYFIFFRNTETGCNADELEVAVQTTNVADKVEVQ